MFQNFSRYEGSKQLEDGEYTARIIGAQEEQKFSAHYMSVKVSIQGFEGCKPDTITLYDIPVLGSMKANGQPVQQADVDRANGAVTRFIDCFGITDLQHINTWMNKTGRVKCAPQYDATEPDKKSKKYKELFPMKAPKADAPAQAPAQQFSSVPPAQSKPQPAPVGPDGKPVIW